MGEILTDDQIKSISDTLDSVVEESEDLKNIRQFPSNNGIEENTEKEEGTYKMMNVVVDPITGENKVTGQADENTSNKSYEQICEDINSGTLTAFDSEEDKPEPLTADAIKSYFSDNDEVSKLILNEDGEIDDETILKLLDICNRRMSGEKFNVYRELPPSIQNLIKSSMGAATIPVNNSNQCKAVRNKLAEDLIDEFISNISIDKIQKDLNQEIEELFANGTGEIADSIIGYTTERNAAYREAAYKIEDEDKRNKMIEVLDNIDEAYNLSSLKEYCTKCKVKHIEIEKAGQKTNVIDSFLNKYNDNIYNIYNIYSAETVLNRTFTKQDSDYNEKDVRAFFIAFCKQCMNYNPSDVNQHAYMYYVLYNIMLIDINTGEKKDVSEKFISNIKECMDNLRVRNNNYN